MIPLSGTGEVSRQQMALNEARAEIKTLKQQVANLEQHNEALFNCWQEAKQIASSNQQRYLEALRDAARKDKIIEELQIQITELETHLNPN